MDTSDHEVNIKILLAAEVAAGRMKVPERDAFLAAMTDEVGRLVLAHNDGQNLALANTVWGAASMAGVHEDWMERLENQGLLDREIEFLPSEGEMESRRSSHQGLTSPELAVLLAYTKIVLEDAVADSELPDDPYLSDRLVNYFPSAMRERYAAAMPEHRLHREIITTVVVNEFVNTSGITCFHRLSGETGAGAPDLIKAQIAARVLFDGAGLDQRIRELDHQVPAQTQTALRMEVRTLVERATRWLVNNRRRPVDISSAVTELGAGVAAVRTALPEMLSGRDFEAMGKRAAAYSEAGVPDELASTIAALPSAYAALTVVSTATRTGLDPVRVARVHFALGQRIGLDRLLGRIIELPRDDRWQTMARAALRDDLHTVHAQLTAEVLDLAPTAGADGQEAGDAGPGLGAHRAVHRRVGEDPAFDLRRSGRPGPGVGGSADRAQPRQDVAKTSRRRRAMSGTPQVRSWSSVTTWPQAAPDTTCLRPGRSGTTTAEFEVMGRSSTMARAALSRGCNSFGPADDQVRNRPQHRVAVRPGAGPAQSQPGRFRPAVVAGEVARNHGEGRRQPVLGAATRTRSEHCSRGRRRHHRRAPVGPPGHLHHICDHCALPLPPDLPGEHLQLQKAPRATGL